MQKSIELFSQKSISKTSIQDITNACNISKGAFYLSFRSKDDLLISLIDYFIKDLTRLFQEVVDEAVLPHQQLENFCATMMNIFYERFPILEMLLTENPENTHSDLTEKVQLFNTSLTHFTILLLEKSYGDAIKHNIFDIQLCFKGIIRSYIEFIVHHKQQYQFQKIAITIVQHLDALVEKQSPPAISEKLFYADTSTTNTGNNLKMAIFNEINQLHPRFSANDFYAQTMHFIQEEIKKEEPNFVILNGMAANLSKEPELKWLATLVKQFAPISI